MTVAGQVLLCGWLLLIVVNAAVAVVNAAVAVTYCYRHRRQWAVEDRLAGRTPRV